jgi:hypothetical protein
MFVPAGCQQTFGEMNPDDKRTVSHRARAFAQCWHPPPDVNQVILRGVEMRFVIWANAHAGRFREAELPIPSKSVSC